MPGNRSWPRRKPSAGHRRTLRLQRRRRGIVSDRPGLNHFVKDGSAQMRLPEAFEQHQWPREPIANPLALDQGESEEEWRERLKRTARHLNARLNKGLKPHQRSIRFVPVEDGLKVTWKYSYGPGKKTKGRSRRQR
jgi:hypothetical protein